MIFDTVVLLIVLASTIFAFFRGFIREVLTVLGVVGGAVAAVYMGPYLSPIVKGWIGVDAVEGEEVPRLFGLIPYTILADILSYGVIFIVFVIILSVVSHFLATWARTIGLGIFDKLLGIIFGVLRAVVLIALLYLPIYQLTDEKQRDEWFPDSHSRSYVEAATGWVMQFLPQASEEDVDTLKKGAEDAASKVGKTIQGIAEKAGEKVNGSEDGKTGENKKEESGYKEEEREDLNQLFEDTVNE